MSSNDAAGELTAEVFENRLEAILERATEGDVDVQGAWDVELEDEPFDLGVEITAISRSE